MRSIAVVTTSRADYGVYLPILKILKDAPGLELRLLASGTHTDAIAGDGFDIAERIDMRLTSDSPEDVAKSAGAGLCGFAQSFARAAPDILVVLGDRYEMHTAAFAALPFRIPVAHIHGGEITTGAFDDAVRHSMTKLSHLHFVATEQYRRRVIQLGEEPWRVTTVGAPSLDNVGTVPLMTRDEIQRALGVTVAESFLLATFHPATLDEGDPGDQAGEFMAALEQSGLPVVLTMPNADPGSRAIRAVIAEAVARNARLQAVENVGTPGYFSLMSLAAAMVGNSSSGIIEAASFRCPVVNVGPRQDGRTRGLNVIDVPARADAILAAIRRAASPTFRTSLRSLENPYGTGNAAGRIVDVLASTVLGPSLIVKRFADAGADVS